MALDCRIGAVSPKRLTRISPGVTSDRSGSSKYPRRLVCDGERNPGKEFRDPRFPATMAAL